MTLQVDDCMHHRSKDPQGTRQAVLFAAYEEIHRQGFQAASLANILHATGLTKGALYHHFANKQQLGYAVLDEIIAPMVVSRWMVPLRAADADPVQVLIDVIEQAGRDMSGDDIALGCPLNNLAQEMSPVDEGFRLRICKLFERWCAAIAEALAAGKTRGQVHEDVDETATAAFVVGALEGCAGIAKNARSRQLLIQCGQGVLAYLNSLRP